MFDTKIILQVSSINIYGCSCNANVGSNISQRRWPTQLPKLLSPRQFPDSIHFLKRSRHSTVNQTLITNLTSSVWPCTMSQSEMPFLCPFGRALDPCFWILHLFHQKASVCVVYNWFKYFIQGKKGDVMGDNDLLLDVFQVRKWVINRMSYLEA